MKARRLSTALALGGALSMVALGALMLTGAFRSEAVQAPTLSLDMDPTGNVYSDPGAGGDNSMSVSSIDACLSTAAPGNNAAHNHAAHIIIQNVEDLEAWQLRMNYDGGKMRPLSVSFAPFTDSLRGQNVSFQNLPIDSTADAHREQTPGIDIPPAAPGPQSALVGSTYLGTRTFALSPDTPAKMPADDASYSAPNGGVVASLLLRVEAGNAGQSLLMDADDGVPNTPGSKVLVFTGTGTQEFNLAESALGDGSHGEGVACGATPTPPPAGGHDARLVRIGGVPKNVRLSPSEVISDSASIVVANDGDHTENIGIYVDISAPAGCSPNTRVHQSTVTLAAGAKTTLSVAANYSCMDPVSANGLSYSWTAVADHGGDDLASCSAGSLQTLACFNALSDDDEDTGDNRKSRAGPKVVAQ